MRKELGFDPGQWGAIEGGRLVDYGAASGLKHGTSQTSAYPRITRPSCESPGSVQQVWVEGESPCFQQAQRVPLGRGPRSASVRPWRLMSGRGAAALWSRRLPLPFCHGAGQASSVSSGRPLAALTERSQRSKLLVARHLLTQQTLTRLLLWPRVCGGELERPLCGPRHHALLPPKWLLCLPFVPDDLFAARQPGSQILLLVFLIQSGGSPVFVKETSTSSPWLRSRLGLVTLRSHPVVPTSHSSRTS